MAMRVESRAAPNTGHAQVVKPMPRTKISKAANHKGNH